MNPDVNHQGHKIKAVRNPSVARTGRSIGANGLRRVFPAGEDRLQALVAACPESVKRAFAYEPGKPEAQLRRERGFEEHFKIIKLASNENCLGASLKAVKAYRQAAGKLHIYPDGACHLLRDALSDSLSLAPKNFVFGNGSEDLISIIVRAFVKPGDEVLMSEACFPIYSIVTGLAEAKQIYAPLAPGFKQSARNIVNAITPNTRLIFLAHPGNPCGSLLSTKDLIEIEKAAPPNAVLFVDEAYHGCVTESSYQSSLEGSNRLNNARGRIITTRSMSKSQGLAGLRIGYAVMAKELAEMCNKTRLAFNLSVPAQAAAVAALEDVEHVEKYRRYLSEEKPRLTATCQTLGYGVVESVSNFILISHPDHSGRELANLIEGYGIIVRPLVHDKLKQFARVTIGTKSENARLLRALKDLI